MHTSVMIRLPFVAALLLSAGCPTASVTRGYPEPAPQAVLDHLRGLKERAATLNALTKTDVRVGGERANVEVSILAAWGGKLRFIAADPNHATAADLASNGERYCFVDVHANCAECGPATADTVARLVRIPLEPDQVVAVLMGATPLLEDAEASVEWQPAGGHEILTLKRGDAVQRVVLDGRDRRWDVLESQLTEGGKTRWRIRHKDFRDVKSAQGQVVRVPTDSIFEESGDNVRISWREQTIGAPLAAGKFQLAPPPGLAACGEPKR